MMRQSEYKKRFDPELGSFTKQHIYGEGITDVFKSFGSKLFGKTMKKAAKKGVEKAVTAAATKTGEHVGKKAGDKIVKLLSREVAPRKIASPPAGGFSRGVLGASPFDNICTILSPAFLPTCSPVFVAADVTAFSTPFLAAFLIVFPNNFDPKDLKTSVNPSP